MMPAESTGGHDGALLRLEAVDKTFTMGQVEVRAAREVSLDILAGEMLVMLGPSGSGKTTLLNLVGGLDTPTAGRLFFRDREMTAWGQPELTRYRRECVGFVFQFYNLVPNLTALENVMVATELSRQPMDPVEALDQVGLADRADHFPAQLSGGEQQRVSIARAIAKSPELLLCDEPTGALDFDTGKRVLRLLIDLRNALGTTIVLITHNTAIAAVADRVVHLRSGEVTEIERNEQPLPPEEVVW